MCSDHEKKKCIVVQSIEENSMPLIVQWVCKGLIVFDVVSLYVLNIMYKT